MFDITKLGPVLDHLRKISPNRYDVKGGEIIIHCPYCGDNSPKHGHLYLSKNFPVWHCFRCESSGTLIRLLIETGFADEELIQYISQFIKYKFIKDYYSTKKKRVSNITQIHHEIIQKNLQFELQYKEYFDRYRKYVISRIGDVDITKFLITPGITTSKLVCQFNNGDRELVMTRFIDAGEKDFRYLANQSSSGIYFFQNRDFEKYNNIVLTEGQFDVICLYLYNDIFKNSFFVAVSGKKYLSAIERLICEELLIGKYQIHMIFDNDSQFYKKYLFNSRLLTKNFNNITIRGWKPIIKKDTADFPAVVEV